MPYTYQAQDLQITYGIIPSRVPGSNIALNGIFNMPARMGKTYHSWGGQNGIEAWVAASELLFGGRDISFHGIMVGTEATINSSLQTFYNSLSSVTRDFITPFGTFVCYVKNAEVFHFPGGATVIINFREIAVTLTGTTPNTGTADHTIDGIPFKSFGLWPKKKDGIHDLPDNKEQYVSYIVEMNQFTVKRQPRVLILKGTLIGTSIADFTTKYKALQLRFASSGLRQVKYNSTYVYCFADEGFTIKNVIVGSDQVVGEFSIALKVTSHSYTGF